MMTILITILTTALVATVGNAVTVMDTPLPFSIFNDLTDKGCNGTPIKTGTIKSVVAMEQGSFCENTVQNLDNGDELTVSTKIVFTSCDAIAMGFVFVDAFTCRDNACKDCTDVDDIPVKAMMKVPNFEPLPVADTCWEIEASSTGITVYNQFDAEADAASIATYWTVLHKNSCMKDTVTIVSEGSSSTSVALVTTMGVLLVAFLLN